MTHPLPSPSLQHPTSRQSWAEFQAWRMPRKPHSRLAVPFQAARGTKSTYYGREMRMHSSREPDTPKKPSCPEITGGVVLSRAQFHSVVICGGGDVVGMRPSTQVVRSARWVGTCWSPTAVHSCQSQSKQRLDCSRIAKRSKHMTTLFLPAGQADKDKTTEDGDEVGLESQEIRQRIDILDATKRKQCLASPVQSETRI